MDQKSKPMTSLLENLIARAWNKIAVWRSEPPLSGGFDLGLHVVDGQVTNQHLYMPHIKRAEHIAVLGKTGTGKSSLLKYLTDQDIVADRGFVHFDLHGDIIPYVLRLVAEQERKRRQTLDDRLIVIEPADPLYSVGLNPLQRTTGLKSFVQIAEVAQILKRRWRLESFGPRTEELLRNSLLVLANNDLTLLELPHLLTDAAFRTACLARTENAEVRAYFQTRYDRASEAMQGVLRDAVLNKVTSFTSDPHFRHILGQKSSSFSLVQAIDEGYWIILVLDKGRLGEEAATLGSLFLSQVKHALFSRQRRNSLFTVYCDEIQNLLAFDNGLESLLSEARKFGVGVCSANQYLDQYPAEMRSAVLSTGTHVLFQLSSSDADKMAAALDGGRSLSELLKNLPQRHAVIKSGHYRWRQMVVPQLFWPQGDFFDLYERCRRRWAKRRTVVEQEIQARINQRPATPREALDDWE